MPAIETLGAGSISYVPVNRIVDHEDLPNRPVDKAHVKSLVAAIEADGLLQPLIVWNGGSDGGESMKLGSGKEVAASFLIAGRHRRDAILAIKAASPEKYKELFPNGVPCVVRGGTTNEAIISQLQENLQRKNPEASEVLPLILHLRDKGEMKGKAIAAAIGKTPAYVSQILSIEESLGEEGVAEVAKGGVKLRHAIEASSAVKKDKKAGKTVDVKKALASAKTKSANTERRVSAKVLYSRYQALPRTNLGEKLTILQETLAYLAGASDEIPTQLDTPETDAKPKGKKKASDEETED